MTNRRVFQAFLRAHFLCFAIKSFSELNPGRKYLHNWHIEVIADALQQCFTGKLRRLVINLPPRYLKSHLASISFPAWILGHRPNAQIVCASYAQDLSDNLASHCRTLMTADWYQDLFPSTRLAANRPPVDDFTTTQRGFRLATSVEGMLTGRGGDFVIIDDPLKSNDALSESRREAVNQWYDHTLFSRLNNKPTARIIVVMQRLHEADLVGHVLKHEDWTVLRFPAIAEEEERHNFQTPTGPQVFVRQQGEALHPQLEPLESLRHQREVMGEYNFCAQYLQSPAPLSGGLVKINWFKDFTPEERPKEFEIIIQSWDTANKPSEHNDFSACVTLGFVNNQFYLFDVLRKRLTYPDLKRTVKDHAAGYGAKIILIEDKASGTPLIQDLIADGLHGVKRYTTKMDKVTRLQSVSPSIENGFVHIPEEASWRPEFLREMAVFPNGKFDDQVDAISQALDWFKGRRSDPHVEVIRIEPRGISFASGSSALQRPRTNSMFGRTRW